MSDIHPTAHRRAPASWLAALERGRADVAAGRSQDAEEFLGQLEHEDAQLNEREPRRAAANG